MSFLFEQLESRLLLTATSVRANGESLIIKLDGGDDDVAVAFLGPNHVTVTINGDTQEFLGPENIKIVDQGGTNNFSINGVVLGGNISIKSGDGVDTVFINGSNFGALKLNLGDGNDRVELTNNVIHYDSRINMGGGDDEVFMGGGEGGAGNNTFGDKFRVHGGKGSDTLVVEGNTFQQQLYVKGNDGDDTVRIVGNQYGDDVKTNGGKGDDELVSENDAIRRDSKKFETLTVVI